MARKKPKIKLPRMKIAPGCEDLFALKGKMLYFVFRGEELPLKELKGRDRKAVGMICEAGWERRSDWLWDKMLNYPSNKSKAFKRFEQEYDAADLQILAWRKYTGG
jgi:hypothetical protein